MESVFERTLAAIRSGITKLREEILFSVDGAGSPGRLNTILTRVPPATRHGPLQLLYYLPKYKPQPAMEIALVPEELGGLFPT
jgi:hypothetical protein